jgi:hypothetical protein
MGCAFDASGYAIYQVQVSGSVQLFALRRIYPSRHVAENGSYAEPLVLWDSRMPISRGSKGIVKVHQHTSLENSLNK